MDAIYAELPLDQIPWNVEDPPALLVDLVASGALAPCDIVDLGCGAGNCAVWLASKGFRATGVDISPKAIELAEDLARRKGVECRFMAADLLGDVSPLHGSFDFAYDWEVLHHIFPGDREAFVLNVHRLLRSGGGYLSVCFSEEDGAFGGGEKIRRTSIGTTLYFSSEDELRRLFEPLFHVRDLRTLEIHGKRGPHLAIAARMSRR
jgi:SAM-dependent methyltransferase